MVVLGVDEGHSVVVEVGDGFHQQVLVSLGRLDVQNLP